MKHSEKITPAVSHQRSHTSGLTPAVSHQRSHTSGLTPEVSLFKQLKYVLLLFCILLITCTKDQTNPNNERVLPTDEIIGSLKVVDNQLIISNYDEGIKLINKLQNIDDQQYIDWCASLNFTSRYLKYILLSRELDLANSKNEFDQILESNKNILYLDKDNFVVPISNHIFEKIVDLNGKVSIENLNYIILRDKSIVFDRLKIPNPNHLISINENDFKMNEAGYAIFIYPKKSNFRGCGRYVESDYKNNSTSDRRIRVDVNCFYTSRSVPNIPGFFIFTGNNIGTIRAYKKGLFGNWTSYQTEINLSYDGVSFHSLINGDGLFVSGTVSGGLRSGNCGSCNSVSIGNSQDIGVSSRLVNPFSDYTKYFISGNSRGVPDNLTMSCNY